MVEDVFKNVQALKGITVDEFMGTMGLMSASLGLCCSDCHPGAGTESVKWEDDSNPRKVTACQMVRMVQAINRDNFSGRQVVTCWTCHHLRDIPLQTPRLDQLYSEAATELDDVVSRADGVPPVNEIIDKYLQAIGGPEKAAGITSVVATGKVEAFGSSAAAATSNTSRRPPTSAPCTAISRAERASGPLTGALAGLRFRWPSCPPGRR